MTSALISSPNFVFTPENLDKAHQFIGRYPPSRQASAVLALLDLAQRQNQGWLSQPAIETVAKILDMPVMRVHEVASFYSLFHLKPIGKFHIQICRTTPCWLRGSEDIKKACEHQLDIKENEVSLDDMFSWVEVECLGACANGPAVQINDTYYEDLTPSTILNILKDLKRGHLPFGGSQQGRRASEPYPSSSHDSVTSNA